MGKMAISICSSCRLNLQLADTRSRAIQLLQHTSSEEHLATAHKKRARLALFLLACTIHVQQPRKHELTFVRRAARMLMLLMLLMLTLVPMPMPTLAHTARKQGTEAR